MPVDRRAFRLAVNKLLDGARSETVAKVYETGGRSNDWPGCHYWMYHSPNQAAEVSIVGPAALQITPVLCISMYTNRVHFLASPFHCLGFGDYYFISTVIVEDSAF